MAVTKVINSESKQYKPVLTDMLVLDAVPTVNSLNGVTSDAVARAIAGASGEVPQVTENDNGKVLTAVYDEGGAAVEWAEAQGGGASYTAGTGINIDENNQISVDTTVSTSYGNLNVGGDNPINMTFTPSSTTTIETTDLISTQQIEEVVVSGQTWLVASYPSNLTEPLDLGALNKAKVVIPAPADTIDPYFSGVNAYYGKADILTYASDALGSEMKFNATGTKSLSPTSALAGGNFDMFGANDPTYSDRASYVYLVIQSYSPNIKNALKDWMATWRVIEWPTEVAQTLVIPSVDQNYNASSTNPQSGTAVASALASMPTPIFYTAGDCIEIEGDEISVQYGSTITKGPVAVSGSFTAPYESLDFTSTTYSYNYALGCGTKITRDLADLAKNGGSATIVFSASASNMFTISPNAPHVGIFFLYDKTDKTKCIVVKSSETNVVDVYGHYYHIDIIPDTSIELDFSDVVCYGGATLSDVSVGDWYLGFGAKGTNYECPTTTTDYWGGLYSNSIYTVPANTLTGSYLGAIDVANPLPASTSLDENKVLTVNSSGDAVWATPATPSVDEVPTVGSTDDGKVLTASYSGGQGSYSWQTAQGGGGSTYTAAAPIAIESDVIKLKYGSDFRKGYPFDISAITGYEQSNNYGMRSVLSFPTLSQYYSDGKFCLVFDTNWIPNYYYVNISGTGMSDSTGWTIIAYKQGSESTDYVYATEVYGYDAATSSGNDKVIVGHGQDVKYYTFTFNKNNVHGDLSDTPLCFAIVPNPADSISGTSPWSTPYFRANGGSLSSYLTDVVKTNTTSYANNVPTGTGSVVADTLALGLKVKLPSYSSLDAGKVLQVQNDGTLAWVTLS